MDYYNDIEPFAADWLEELIKSSLLPAGALDRRSILRVLPNDVVGARRAHFFAGIGGWAHALENAGWPKELSVWTGSCPCQPFSVAGKQLGEKDERHLWPVFRRLIGQLRPPVIFGEQVASPAGREWLSGVRADLEEMGYAVGAADLCAAGVSAPHIRQRLYWVADSVGARLFLRGKRNDKDRDHASGGDVDGRGADGGVADATSAGRGQARRAGEQDGWSEQSTGRGQAVRVVDAVEPGLEGYPGDVNRGREPGRLDPETAGSAPAAGGPGRLADADGGLAVDAGVQRGGEQRQQQEDRRPRFWDRYSLVHCTDGKARRVEPGVHPLAHGIPARVGKLRAYGNAIVPEVAEEFIRAYLGARF